MRADRRVPCGTPFADHIARIVDAAPPISTDQRDRLAVLIRPVSVSGGRAA